MMTSKLLVFASLLFPFVLTSQAAVKSNDFILSKWEAKTQKKLSQNIKKIEDLLNMAQLENKIFQQKETREKKVINAARRQYEKNQLSAALKSYQKIERGSDYWLEAVEEKGWAHYRLGNYEKTLAETKTLLSEPFVQLIGSEPFFLQSLTQLKICDYKGVLETQELFKDSQRKRIEAIEKLAQTGSSIAFLKLIDKIDRFPIKFVDVGQQANELPRLFYKDLELQKQLFRLKLSTKALSLLSQKLNNSKSDAKTQLDLQLVKFKQINATADRQLYARMKVLAEIENQQNLKMLQKLGLIEVETIQRMHSDQKLDRKAFRKGEFKDVSDNDLVFPDDKHPWIDELDKYEVKTNSCPQNLRRKM